MSKVLVTGNKGYIGSVATHELLKAGHEVVGYDIGYFQAEPFGRTDVYESVRKVEQIVKDIRDVTVDDMKGIDTVMHFAALPNDYACDLVHYDVVEDINYLGAMEMAIAAKRAGVERFIFASSCSVYGVNGDKLINENSIPAPITPYGFSKLKAESALQKMSSEDFTVTCMRNATCYGVSPRMRFDMVLNNLVGWAYTTGKVNMYLSDGTSWRPLVHIEDLSRAYILAMEADKELVAGEIFSAGAQNVFIKDVAEIAKATVPSSIVEYAPNAPKDWRSYRVSNSKIEQVLGFKPAWTVEKGAKELYDAYEVYGLDEKAFNPKLPTVKVDFWAGKNFKYLIESGKVDKNMRLL